MHYSCGPDKTASAGHNLAKYGGSVFR